MSEDAFVPLAPCRIVDTRHGGGAVVSGATRTVQATGTAGFPAQGGKSGGCGVPASATAVSVSVTASSATSGGYLTAYPAGSTRPLSTTVSYLRGSALTASSTVKLGGGQLSVYNHGGTATVIVDVNGYVAVPIHASVAPDGTLYSASARVLSVTHTSTGQYTVVTDTNIAACSVSVTIRGGIFYGDGFSQGNNIAVTTWALNSTAGSIPTNLYFDVSVTC